MAVGKPRAGPSRFLTAEGFVPAERAEELLGTAVIIRGQRLQVIDDFDRKFVATIAELILLEPDPHSVRIAGFGVAQEENAADAAEGWHCEQLPETPFQVWHPDNT